MNIYQAAIMSLSKNIMFSASCAADFCKELFFDPGKVYPKYNNMEKCFEADFTYQRNHPFVGNWENWPRIVENYYHGIAPMVMDQLFGDKVEVSKLAKAIDKRRIFQEPRFNPSRMSIVYGDLPYSQVKQQLDAWIRGITALHAGDFYELSDLRYNETEEFHSLICTCYRYDSMYAGNSHNWFPFNRFGKKCCPFYVEHIKTVLCGALLNFIDNTWSTRLKRYYVRLMRVILALEYEQLCKIDSKFLNDFFFYPNYKETSANMLFEIYSRGHLDSTFDLDSITQTFEQWKHIREQSATYQSESGGFGELMESMCGHIQEQGLFSNMTHSVDDATFEKFSNLMKESQARFMVDLRSTLVDTAGDIMAISATISIIALLGTCIAKFGLKVVSSMLQMLYRFVTGTAPSVDGIIQQSEGISVPLVPAMILNTIISPPAKILGALWNNPQTDKIMRRIGYLGDPKMAKGVDKISEWVNGVVQEVINWFKREFLGIHVAEDIDTKVCPIVSWYEECDAFCQSYYDGTMQWNDINWSVLMNLYGRGTALARQPNFIAHKNDIWRVVNKLGNVLEKFNSHGRSSASVRNPPVTLYLYGDTGVGKSSVTYPFAAEILKGINDREPLAVDLKKYWKNLIYMRSAEQEFWDGYENQLVTVFDDFNQQVDSQANPSTELFEVIRASNSFPYPLHMAAIDQKANTSFTSKIIMVSSNMEKPRTQSLNFEQALFRRFDISVRVSRKHGVKVNPGKFDPSIYKFERYDMVNGGTYGSMSYDEVIEWCVNRYFERKGFVDSMDAYISEKLSENVEQAEEAGPSQQGFGTALGNTVNAMKNAVKTTGQRLYCEYLEFKGAVSGKVMERPVTELSHALVFLREKKFQIQWAWENFKADHPYFFKALKVAAIIALVTSSLAMLYSFTRKQEKPKIMSAEQFIKSTPMQSESYNPAQIKSIKAEAYADAKITPIRHESNGMIETCACGFDEVIENCGGKSVILVNCDHGFQQQAVLDMNASEMLVKTLRSNLYKIYEGKSGNPIGHCFFAVGNVCIMPNHYTSTFKRLLAADPEDFIEFRNVLLDRSFSTKCSDILELKKAYFSPEEGGVPSDSRDIMSVAVPSAIQHADISGFFASKTALQYVQTTKLVMPILCNNNIKKSDKAVVCFKYAFGRGILSQLERSQICDDTNQIVRYIRDLWQYSMDTQQGDCGSPIFVRNKEVAPGKIIGMHVAGWDVKGLGYATPLYVEDISAILATHQKSDKIIMQQSVKYVEVAETTFHLPQEAQFVRLGKVATAVAQPSKTKIEKSLIYGKVREPCTKPCALTPWRIDGEVFDPREYRLKRLGNVPKAVSQKHIGLIQKALVDEISQKLSQGTVDPTIKPVYTFEEAVTGVDGEDYINSVKRTTSPGYPFIHLKGFKTRKEIFGSAEEVDFTTPSARILKRKVEHIIDLAKKGIALEHVFMDTLKDERKPIHKAHKTRLFSAGPIDYLIACKMYFNGIVALLQDNRNACHISVGSNPLSSDWHNIVKELHRKSKHIVAGDFEGFDSSQNLPMLRAASEVLIELSRRFCGSSDEDVEVMRVLMVSLLNSVHINGNEVYKWTHSLPSGHYLTAIINSVFVCLSFGMVWMQAQNQFTYYCARYFFEQCGIVAYGDDHLVAIPSRFLDIFNQINMPDLFKVIGLSYTMEDKDAKAESLSRTIQEVSYLKRSFVYDEDRNRWLAPLSLDTILETPMWMHKTPDKLTQTRELIDWSLRELSVHDVRVWVDWSDKLKSLGNQLGHYTKYDVFGETRALVLGD